MKPKTTSNWKQWHKDFREFLSSIPMDKYRKLREIKTVEQDLPKELNPLPWIYKFYYPEEEKPTFPEFEEFFEKYWHCNLVHLEKFIRKYFYGCSLQFVYEGFQARLWRTWISLLTQFDFAYLWNDLFGTHAFLEASAELDMQGLDGMVHFSSERRIGIQIKKISYRREASQRRFAKRKRENLRITFIAEIPYVVDDPEELKEKEKRARTEDTRNRYKFLRKWIDEHLERLDNGFVVFKEQYIQKVHGILKRATEDVGYEMFFLS